MGEILYGKTSQKSSWKPRISSEGLPFYHCSNCNKTLIGIDSDTPTHYTGGDRDPMIVYPYMNWDTTHMCCGKEMERITTRNLEELPEDVRVDYEITGGLGDNIISLEWDSSEEGSWPDWVALKTFTGMQMKYRLPGETPHFAFAVTETDAYAYCAEDPCLKCIFHCKRGNVLYAHTPLYGLVAIPIHENDGR